MPWRGRRPSAATRSARSGRRLTPPPGTGGKGSYGHRHKTQEEIYLVLSGRLEFKLEDEVVELGPLTAVRVAPQTARSVWNAGPEEALLVIASTRSEDPKADAELVEDFWPAS